MQSAGKKHKQVSVVMITFNGAKYLEKQLQSIFVQTLAPAEIIVCDDASTDETVKILEKYSRQGLLRFTINTERLGVIGNFKKAVAMAMPGNYIALADQDDIWLPEKLYKTATLLADIDNQGPALVYSDLQVIGTNDQVMFLSFWQLMGFNKYSHNFKTNLFGNLVTGCTIIFNDSMRAFFSGIPPEAPMHDAWLALIGFSFGKISRLDEQLVRYRKHENNTAFVKTEQKTAWKKALHHIQQLFDKTDFLEEQIILADLFYRSFKDKLTSLQKKEIQLLIQLRGKSHLQKKTTFERVFFRHWIKRI